MLIIRLFLACANSKYYTEGNTQKCRKQNT